MPNLSPSPGNWFPSLCSMTLEVRAPAPRFSFDFVVSQRDLVSSSQIILPMNVGGKKTKHNLKKRNPEKNEQTNRTFPEDGANVTDCSRRVTGNRHWISVDTNRERSSAHERSSVWSKIHSLQKDK